MFEIDGIWAGFPDPPTDWLPIPDEWNYEQESDFPGMEVLPFASGSLFGGTTSTGGDIFNLQLTFSQPGEYHLSFLNQTFDPTTYQNYSGDPWNYYDISNDAAPAITVVE